MSFLPFPSFIFSLSFHFSRDQNRKSRSSVFFCSETRKRLLRRLQSALFSGYKGLRSRVRVGVRIRVRLGVRVRIRVREREKVKGKIKKIGWSDFNIVSVRLSCRQPVFPGLLGQCISVTYPKRTQNLARNT